MSANVASRMDTATPYLRDLISSVNKGEMKVPQFQRAFVWVQDKALRLLDRIAKNIR